MRNCSKAAKSSGMATRWSYIMQQGRQHFHALSSPFDSNQTANQTGRRMQLYLLFLQNLATSQWPECVALCSNDLGKEWQVEQEKRKDHLTIQRREKIIWQLPRNKGPELKRVIALTNRQFSLLKRSKLIPTCIYDLVSVCHDLVQLFPLSREKQHVYTLSTSQHT
jgi:hypothetical protein